MSIFKKHAETAEEGKKFLLTVRYKNPEHKKKNDHYAEAFGDMAKTLLLMEIQMADAALAIDKLETELDLRGAAIAARDRKIASLTTQLATAQQNSLDAADLADIQRVKDQTFDPIPPVADDTTTTPPADTTTPPVTTGA